MFVQVIEGRTSDADGMKRQGDRWQQEVGPVAVGFVGVTSGVAPDGRAITLARFESEDAARANEQLAEQTAWAEEMFKYYDAPPTFTESSDTQEHLSGDVDQAGFVQVMKRRGVDRDHVDRLDALFEKHLHLRPEILGLHRVWTGPDSCIEVAYFTSEAAARDGEGKEMPEDLQQAMADMGDVIANTEFLDLPDPMIR